jgi:hypothetical protein
MSRKSDRIREPATFYIHLEPADRDIVWWAETEAVPGLSIAAPTLRALRGMIEEAARDHLRDVQIELELVANEPETEHAPVAASEMLPPRPAGAAVRTALIPIPVA